MDALLAQIYTVRDELFQQAEEARAKVAKGEDIVEKQQSQNVEDDTDWLTEGEAA
jgi:hypothetical protein